MISASRSAADRVRTSSGVRVLRSCRDEDREEPPWPRCQLVDRLAVLPGELGDLAEVVAGQAAEDDLDGGGAPQHRGGVGAPAVAGLGQGLQARRR